MWIDRGLFQLHYPDAGMLNMCLCLLRFWASLRKKLKSKECQTNPLNSSTLMSSEVKSCVFSALLIQSRPFFTVLCIEDSTFSWKQRFKVKKNILFMDLLLLNMQLFTLQNINGWAGVVWITCGLWWYFISCLISHSDGTHSLQRQVSKC